MVEYFSSMCGVLGLIFSLNRVLVVSRSYYLDSNYGEQSLCTFHTQIQFSLKCSQSSVGLLYGCGSDEARKLAVPEAGLIKCQFFIVLEAERFKTKVLADGSLVYVWSPSYCDLVWRRRKTNLAGFFFKNH